MLQVFLSMIDSEADRSKFELIYNRYRRLMKYIALQILHDDGLAEDALQDAFLKLSKNMSHVLDADAPQTKNLMIILIKNTALNLKEKWKQHRMVSIDDTMEQLDADADHPADFVESTETKQTLDDALRALPEPFQEVLLMRYIHNYPEKRIAELLDISPELVRKRLERAKKRLMAYLQEGDAVQ